MSFKGVARSLAPAWWARFTASAPAANSGSAGGVFQGGSATNPAGAIAGDTDTAAGLVTGGATMSTTNIASSGAIQNAWAFSVIFKTTDTSRGFDGFFI